MKEYKDEFIKELFDILNTKHIKQHIRNFMEPVVQLLFQEVYFYLIVSIVSIITIFILNLAIFIFMIKIYWDISKK